MAKDPIKTLEAIEKGLDQKVAAILDECAKMIKARVDSQEFIHWKSGRKPIVVKRARLVGNMMTAPVRAASGWKWGHVLIGPAGETTIVPKRGKFLAIPTDFVPTVSGGGKARARGYSGKFIFDRIIWGQVKSGSGLRQRGAAGEKIGRKDLVPLYILKGSITVRRRVIPSYLIAWIRPIFMEKLKSAGLLKA